MGGKIKIYYKYIINFNLMYLNENKEIKILRL